MRGQCLRIGLVGDLSLDAQQGEHLLHVHQTLLDGHVDHAKEVKWLI